MKIGKYSCNQAKACANATNNVIGDDACSGNLACEYAANNHVGDLSCVNQRACRYAESNKIRRNACYGYRSCEYAKQNVIGAKSCTHGLYACNLLEQSNIKKRSCLGRQACSQATYIDTCKWSCVGYFACSWINRKFGSPDNRLTIGASSCHGYYVCSELENVSNIGPGSCILSNACRTMIGNNGTIPAATIGDNSCIGRSSCEGYLGPMIGDNACVGRGICANCSLAIEDGQCNENIIGSICNCPLVTEPFIVIQDEEIIMRESTNEVSTRILLPCIGQAHLFLAQYTLRSPIMLVLILV